MRKTNKNSLGGLDAWVDSMLGGFDARLIGRGWIQSGWIRNPNLQFISAPITSILLDLSAPLAFLASLTKMSFTEPNKN